MTVHLTEALGNEIARAVLMGVDPGQIAEIADSYIREKATDHTFTTFGALRYFIRESAVAPKKYIGVSGADRIDRTELGSVITMEFWSWSDFIEADFIAETCNVIADAVIRFDTKARRRFR